MSACEQIDSCCCKRCLRNFLRLQISQKSRVKPRIRRRLMHSRSTIAEVKILESRPREPITLISSVELERFRQGSASAVRHWRTLCGEGNYCTFCRRAISFLASLSSDSDHSTRPLSRAFFSPCVVNST